MPNYPSAFKVYDEAAHALLGDDPKLELLHTNDSYPFAHEAGVYIPSSNTLWITSNQHPHPVTSETKIQISRITLPSSPTSTETTCTPISAPSIPLANGAVNYKDGILFCAQGTLTTPGGLAYLPLEATHTTQSSFPSSSMLVSSFHGRHFNSPNDVVVHSDGSIWFTDPCYGWEQGIRPRPQLPNQVYRFDPNTGGVRVVADGFGRPNGICFAPGEEICYVTDTDWVHGDGGTDGARVSTIYAFDVKMYSGQPFLINRRLFAMADTGIPDGIKCDVKGNVYSGCGDGVNIWSPGGVLLAKILVDGGVANFCFGRDGQMFLLNESRLWRAQIAPESKGALLGL